MRLVRVVSQECQRIRLWSAILRNLAATFAATLRMGRERAWEALLDLRWERESQSDHNDPPGGRMTNASRMFWLYIATLGAIIAAAIIARACGAFR
jgi:hypothetical protein